MQIPAHGTAVANANGTVTYTHDGSNTTSDSFTYTIKDNSGAASNVATVSITVTAVNDPPVAVNDVLTVNEGASGIVNVAANDTDSDGTVDLTSIVIVQNPVHGTAVVHGDGTVTYTHNGSETTSDSFTYTVRDNLGAVSGTATVNITVTPVNDAPIATNDVVTVAEGGVLSIPVSTNDLDADGTIDVTSILILQSPAHGTAVANANGTVTYTHDGTNTTSDSITYTIKDNSGAVSNVATVSITVTAVNDPPVVVDDVLTVDEGASGVVDVAANDTDSDGTVDLTTIVIVQNPVHGTAVVHNNGTVSYTHNGSETTSDSFTYTVRDNLGTISGTATVSITVLPVNDAPIAVDDVATIAEGGILSIPVYANDTDADGTIDATSLVIILNPAHGTAVANANGTVTYTHDGSNTLSDSFTYTIKDNSGAVSNVATVSITVTAVNDPPVSVNDVLTMNEGSSGVVNVVANDTDSDGTVDLTTIVIVQNPVHGTVVVHGDGTVTYTHNGSETTSDSFTYTVRDNLGAISGTATVNITITPVNDAPVAANDVVNVAEGGVVIVNVAANDSDVDGSIDLTSIVIVQDPAHGTVTVNNNGTVTYTHDGSQTTSDSFTYTIQDNDGATSNVATVLITVAPFNNPPVATDDVATVNEGGSGIINVAANDIDVDSTLDLTSIVITQSPVHGTVTVNNNGSVTYTHNGSETTSDSFEYTISDIQGAASNTATVNVTITPVNDAPVAADDSDTVDEGNSVIISVAANDTDVDGTLDLTSIVIVQIPAHGSAAANPDGTVTYTHDGSETTTDSFTYTIKDNNGLVSGTATVMLSITPVNDAPVAVNDEFTIDEDGSLNLPAPGILGNDTDAEGNSLTAILVNGPLHGSLSLAADGSLTYTPDPDFNGIDGFSYLVNDGVTNSAVAAVTINVTSVNDAPVAVDDSDTVDEGASVVINVAANDTDVDNTLDLTSILIVQNPANGTVVVHNDGTVTYFHDGSETTSDSFTYTIQDNLGAVSGTATVTITVTPVNDAPVAVDDSDTVDEENSVIIAVAANDTDVDGTIDVSTVVIVQNGAHGTAVANPDGTVTYTHDGSETTTDSFTYTIKDNNGLVSGTATVTLSITPVNDAPVAVNDEFTIDEDGFLNLSAPGVLGNDTDAEGNALTAILVTGPLHGSLSLAADGSLTYTPDPDFNGIDGFSYLVNDGAADSTVAAVTINVTSVNDAPVAANDAVTVDEGDSVIIDIAANATDVDSSLDLTSIVITTNPAHGTLQVHGDGTVTYTHDGSETTSDSFEYTIKDAQGLVSGTATVSITINPVNDPPMASDDLFDVAEDSGLAVSGNVLTNDLDPEGTQLVVSAVGGQSGNVGADVAGLYGMFHINADGSFTYVLDDANPTVDALNDLDEIIDSIAYDVTDGQLTASASAIVHIHGHTD